MSGQILGLDHVNFTASHEMIDELCRFYVEILGLKTGDRPPFDRHGYWIYAGDQPIIHLIVNRAGDEREMGRNTSFDHVALHCQGARDMVARLDALGVAYRLQLIPRTGAHQIFLRDPAGHGVELNFEIGDDPAQPIAKDWT
jgi:catechol 2,3-dioxygenase-like lactoylglutathione lyase family enzyme